MDNQVLDEDFNGQKLPNLQHADFGIRLGAFLLDYLVLLPLVLLHYWNMLVLKSLMLSVLLILLIILYKPLYEHFYKATIGKKYLGLQVLTTGYKQINLEQSFLRSAPWVITSLMSLSTFVTIFKTEEFSQLETVEELSDLMLQYQGLGDRLSIWLILISCLFVLFNQQKQALHDQLADTVVVYKQ